MKAYSCNISICEAESEGLRICASLSYRVRNCKHIKTTRVHHHLLLTCLIVVIDFHDGRLQVPYWDVLLNDEGEGQCLIGHLGKREK